MEKQTNEPAFLPRDPWDIMTSGDYNMVPLLTGFCNNEGLLFEVIINMKLLSPEETYDNDPSHVVPLQFGLSPSKPLCENIKNKIEHYYKNADGKFSTDVSNVLTLT